MTDTLTTPGADTWRWWEARRLRYNIGLAFAGWTAWVLFVLESWWFLERFSLSISTTLAQGLFWLLAMAAANAIYLLGPVSERVLRPADPDDYRRRMFGLGFWFSMAVPFFFPAIVLVFLLMQQGF